MKTAPAYWLAVLALATACQRRSDDTPQPAEDPDWVKLEIPNAREAHAVAGDFDHTLLVTTYTKAYYSTDRGATWQESRDFQGHIPALAARHDTLVALETYSTDAQGRRTATRGQQFTTDYGRSWTYASSISYALYNAFITMQERSDLAQAPGGPSYQIKANTTPVSPGSLDAYINPSDLLRVDATGTHPLRLPARYIINNVHLDAQGRLYVAVDGGTHQPATNTVVSAGPGTPAIIYVSRRPLP